MSERAEAEETEVEWDFFLAHAGVDTRAAEALYDHLHSRARTFLDSRSLDLGDDWDRALPEAQRRSRVTVVLVSKSSERAYFQRTEIAEALDLARRHPNRHRVVPLFLHETASLREDVPYGLRLKHGLSATDGRFEVVAERLVELKRRLDLDEDGDWQEADRGSVPGWLQAGTTGFVGLTERGPPDATLITSWEEYAAVFGPLTDPAFSFLSHAVRGFFDNGGRRAYVARVEPLGAQEASLELATDGDDPFRIAARTLGEWGNRILVRIQDGTRLGFRLTAAAFDRSFLPQEIEDVRGRGSPLGAGPEPSLEEDYDNLGWDPEGPNYFPEVINARSRLIEIPDAGTVVTARPANGAWLLAEGSDGDAVSWQDYAGDRNAAMEEHRGLAALRALEDVSLVCVPDQVHPRLDEADREGITFETIAHCERCDDRFALLSAPPVDASDLGPPPDTSRAAMYWPWVQVPNARGDEPVALPPCGHVAGLYAHNDSQRGLHHPPVDLALSGLADEPLTHRPSDEEADRATRLGINPLRLAAPGDSGARLASAVTLAIEDTLKDVGAERLVAYLKKALTGGLGWTVFEPKTEATWEKARREVAELLHRLFQRGAFAGNSPEEAFFVRCDETTNTQNDVDNDRLVLQVGFVVKGSSRPRQLTYVSGLDKGLDEP